MALVRFGSGLSSVVALGLALTLSTLRPRVTPVSPLLPLPVWQQVTLHHTASPGRGSGSLCSSGDLTQLGRVTKGPGGASSEGRCHAGACMSCCGLLSASGAGRFLSQVEEPSSEEFFKLWFHQVNAVLAGLLCGVSCLLPLHTAAVILRYQLLLLPPCSGKGSKNVEKSQGEEVSDRLELFLIYLLPPFLPWGRGAPRAPG